MPRKCTNCFLRAWYDRNPQSLLGRLWRWHANWCPGWKNFLNSLPPGEKAELIEKYHLKKSG